MTSVSTAIMALGIEGWVCEGSPTNEAEFNLCFKKIIGADEHGSAILSSDPADFGVTWAEILEKKAEIAGAKPLQELREMRNDLLAETDWWASTDLTMTPEQTAYRQALRDITDTYQSLDNVVWPTKPE